jgi:hypothetical protein
VTHPSWPLSARLPLLAVALLVLAGVALVATRRYWRPWLDARRAPPEPLRTESTRTRDERLKLALWASGEHFWDYDLVQRKL